MLGSKYLQASATTCINPQVAMRLVAAFSCGLNDRISLRENEKRRSGLRLVSRKQTVKYKSVTKDNWAQNHRLRMK